MLLIGNGKIFTRNQKNPYIENGAILINDNIIKDIGETKVLKKKYKQVKYKDVNNKLIMPGFINTHHHYYSTFARGMFLKGNPPSMFSDILRGLWWRLDKGLTLEDVYYSALVPMIEEIKNGVTTVIDHHASPYSIRGSLFAIFRAAKELNLRRNLSYEVSDRDGEKKAEEGILENLEFAKFCNKENDDM